jgi:hypothetical protein
VFPEKHTKRQVTQHDCLPSLLGNGNKWFEIVYGEKIFFELVRLEQVRQDKNLLYPHNKPDDPIMEGPFACVLFESPFTSISTVSSGHPSLVSLVSTIQTTAKSVVFFSNPVHCLSLSCRTIPYLCSPPAFIFFFFWPLANFLY